MFWFLTKHVCISKNSLLYYLVSLFKYFVNTDMIWIAQKRELMDTWNIADEGDRTQLHFVDSMDTTQAIVSDDEFYVLSC